MNQKRTVVVVVAVLLLVLLTAAVTFAEAAPACNGLSTALNNIPPDSPGRAKVEEKALANECGYAIDHAALVALYNSAGGAGWINTWPDLDSDHCSADNPWYGVSCHPDTGRVFMLSLGTNNLQGQIPPELGSMSGLYYLWLNRNPISGDGGLTGTIPAELSNLSNFGPAPVGGTLALQDTNLGCWETQEAYEWAQALYDLVPPRYNGPLCAVQ